MGKVKASKTKTVKESHFDPKKTDPNKHIVKLTALCHAIGIEVVYKDTAEKDNEFSSDGKVRRITLYPDKNKWTVLTCLIHELGHAFDEGENPEGFWSELRQEKAPTAVERQVERKNWVIQAEERAWYYGRRLAKFAQIPVGKWFYHRKDLYLNTYKKSKPEDYKKRNC
jgi:hypothetical protein